MQELLIQSLEIDWSEIDARDYLRSIHAIQAIERLEFHSPVTFLPVKTAAASQRCWRPSRLPRGLTRRAERRTIAFLLMILIPGLRRHCGLYAVRGVPNGDIFCEQKVFTMWQHRKKTMQNCSACQRAITENRMARVFWHWHSRSSARKGCIC